MNKMIFNKGEAQVFSQFLIKLELRNKTSRLRNKLAKKLDAITVELEEERIELLKELAIKDENGEPVIVEINGQQSYDVQDKDELANQINELRNEKVAVEVGEYSSNFAPLFEYLDSEEFDMILSGQDALIYDELLTIWEDANTEREEN